MNHSKNTPFGRVVAMVLTLAMMLSLVTVVPAGAAWTMEELNPNPNSASAYGQSYDVDAVISLAADQNISVSAPVSVDADTINAAAEAGQITLSLTRDSDRPYLDPQLYPNVKDGGSFDSWQTQGNTAMFDNIVVSAADGQVTIDFDALCYFYGRNGAPDYSAPHSSGGAYLDICGYFTLTAAIGDDEICAIPVKVAPYVDFHTMDEVYVQLDEIVAEGNDNGLYVVRESMGKSTSGRDMPYIIVADSKSTVDTWLTFTEESETNPTQVLADIKAGAYDDIRVPVMFSNIHANEVSAVDGVLNLGQALVDAGINGSITYNTLTGFTEEGSAQLQKEFDAKGLAVPDLIADKASYLGYIQDGNGKSGKVDLDKFYTQEDVTVSMKDLLSGVFFIIVPEENVDGRTYVTRTSSNGYDLNRDNSFQTTSETANMQQLIGTYNPVSVTEFHGRVTAFQCEPCDPPHEPNFEYDLLANHLIAGGEAFGIVAVANNDEYNSYVIPQRDYLFYTDESKTETYWEDPWDDMSTSYTPQFAMLHGAVAYTVEQPAYCDSTARAVTYGCVGQANYIAAEKLSYLADEVAIYERGVTNANSDAYELVGQWLCDQYDVEGAEMDLFRPEYTGEGQNGNFYPECYIIPLDGENQSNLQAAWDMILWLTRNDVKVSVTTAEVTYNGVTYPAGTLIVPMDQAKRSVANGALYDGTLIQSWTVLYSEGITTFNETRGFDMVTVAEPAAYATISAVAGARMDYAAATAYVKANEAGSFTGIKNADVVISNASEDSTAAVNYLLAQGKTVGMITEGSYQGDFICTYDAYTAAVAQGYIISATGINAAEVTAQTISGPATVYLTGVPTAVSSSGFAYNSQVTGSYDWNYDRIAMELMGFTTTENVSDATVIVGASSLSGDALTAVQNGTPYIGYGSTASRGFGQLVEGLTRTGLSGAMDCLAYVTYPNTNLINASYVADGDDVMYGYGYGYFSAVPEDAVVLVSVDGSRTPTEGFIPTNTPDREAAYQQFLQGGVLGVAVKNDTLNVALFANTLTNKGHQRDEYAYISNFIFSSMLTEESYSDSSTVSGAILYTVNSDNELEYNVVYKGDVSAATVTDTTGNGITSVDALQKVMGTVDKPATVLGTDTSSRTIGKAVTANLTLNADGAVTAIQVTAVKDRPVVGISWKKDTIGTDYQGFAEAYERNGALAVFLPQATDAASATEILKQIDGIFFTGGEDWNPALYNETAYTHGSSGWNDARDTSDLNLMQQAIVLDVPLFAVCRGEQGFNVAMGGALIQDVPTYQGQRVKSGEVSADRVTGVLDDVITKYTQNADGSYSITKTPCETEHYRVQLDGIIHSGGTGYHILNAGNDGTGISKDSKWLYDIVGDTDIEYIATAHHQAADPERLGNGITVAAISGDGIIEAIEYQAASFALAIQWHPERDALKDTRGVDVDQDTCNALLRALVEHAYDSMTKDQPAPSGGGSSGGGGGGGGSNAGKVPTTTTTTTPTTPTTEPTTGKTAFTDVVPGSYYEDAVVWASENGVTSGTSATTFSPDATCTRGQVVTFLWRAAGSPAPENQVSPFSDVTDDGYYYTAVLWAVENGITNGTSETTFSPNDTVTRAQVVTFLFRANAADSKDIKDNPFNDVAVSDYFCEPVLWAVQQGITNGTSETTFSPDNGCTRAQTVTFLYRAQ